MRIDWKCFVVAMVVVMTVAATFSVTVMARDGGAGAGAGRGMGGGAAGGGQMPAVSGGGSQGMAGGERISGGNVQTGGGVQTGGMAGERGQISGGQPGQTGMEGRPGMREGMEGRTFDKNSFFQGHDINWWRTNHKHYFWNGNAWVFGVEPAGFVAVPVPVSSCPYNPGMYGGDPNACFFSCIDNGYDPVSVCDVCCGTNY